MRSGLSRRALLSGAGVVVLSGCTDDPAPAPTARPSSVAPSSPAAPPVLDLAGLEREFGGRIGAWARNMATGVNVGWREDERFPLCSTFKMLAAAAVAEMGVLDERITWSRSDRQPNSPVTDKRSGATGMTVAELCEAAVTVSDNTAGNLLLRRIGGPESITRFARTHGDAVTRLDRWEPALNDWKPGEVRDTTSPAAMGGLAVRVAAGNASTVQWMRGATTGGKRIRAGLPREWKIGDKTGTGGTYGTANDVAIAEPPGDGPLIFSVFTNRPQADAEPDESVLARAAAAMVSLIAP